MTRQTCITPPKKALFFCIREEYVGLCKEKGMKHPHCAAALLHCFQHWFDYKLALFEEELTKYHAAKKAKQAARVKVNMWIYMSQPDFKKELQGLFGDKVISQSLQDLVDAKLLKTRSNPENSWDRTTQYLFFSERVQNEVDLWACSSAAPSRVSAVSKRQKRGINAAKLPSRSRKTAAALPQDSPQDSPQGEGALTPEIPNVPVVKEKIDASHDATPEDPTPVSAPPPPQISDEEARLIIASPRSVQRFSLNLILTHPIIEAYERATGAKIIVEDTQKLTALKAQVAGYTPDEVYELTVRKLKEKGGDYPFAWMINDLPSCRIKVATPPSNPIHRRINPDDITPKGGDEFANLPPDQRAAFEELTEKLTYTKEVKKPA